MPNVRASHAPGTSCPRGSPVRVPRAWGSGPDRGRAPGSGAARVTFEPSAETGGTSTGAVLRNRPLLLLWLSQLATPVGSNMVLFGLTVIVFEATNLRSAVRALFLTFLVPPGLLSAA